MQELYFCASIQELFDFHSWFRAVVQRLENDAVDFKVDENGLYIGDEDWDEDDYDVEVEYKTLEKRIYSNIKNTEAYAKRILASDENVKSVKVIGESKKDWNKLN